MMGSGGHKKKPSPEGGRSALDAVRAVACLLVLVGHAAGVDPLGPLGVSIFFVLSGYLIWRPWRDGSPALGSYAVHRIARIAPGYLLAVAILVPWSDWLRYATFTPGFRWTVVAPVHASWTLGAEVLFYALVPLIARVRYAPAVVMLASLAFALMLVGDPTAEMAPAARLWQFAPGMFLGRRAWWWLPAGIAAGIVSFAFPLPYLNLPAVLAGTFLVGWAIGREVPFRRLAAVGAALTFPVYLWHQDMLARFGLAGVVVVVLVASGSYLLLERPVLRLIRRGPRPGSRPSWHPSPSPGRA